MAWMAVHVFEPEPLEPLLLDVIAGLARTLKTSGQVRRFFFVRYAERGYHVRLRFEVAAAGTEAVRANVAGALRRYFDGQGKTTAIDSAPYEPELARYGGAAGVDIAEDHFDFSSEMALRMIEHTRDRSEAAIAARFGLALEASLALAGGFGLQRLAIGELFRGYLASTLAAIAQSAPDAAFSRGAASQADRLRQVGCSVFDDGDRGSAWAVAWRTHGRALAARLAAARVCEPTDVLTPISGRLVSSYVHMFINRLGLFGAPESYLCYLAHEVCGGSLAGASDTVRR